MAKFIPLKKIQQKIQEIFQQIELPAYAFGSVKGKNNILNAQQHIESKYFLTIDLKDFFTNINHHQVFRMFSQNRFSPTVSRILTQLTTYKGSLPQGTPTSPVISNLVFTKTGNKLLAIARNHQIIFTSFVDDLSFSSKKDFKFLIPSIIEVIKSDGFYIHNKKVHYKTYRPEVTGLIIHHKQLMLPKDMMARAKENKYIAAYVELVKKMSA